MKIINIVGARPQFIKLDPILRSIEQHNLEHPDRGIADILVHTGQHYDHEMSKIFFEELDLREPDYHLGVGSGTHAHQTGEMLKRIEEVLINEKPDIVMVYGDTNSTLAGALSAAKLHIPVAHVEAGLRSFNKTMPEEINRILTDHISDLLFCPTQTAVNNLSSEGIHHGVYEVGDVMYDALLMHLEIAEKKSDILSKLELCPHDYCLATIHRAENTDDLDRLASIFSALSQSGERIIVPIHPRTEKKITQLDPKVRDSDPIRIISPLPYLDMLILEKHARLIITDSGGVQKEAFFLKVPCLTVREETEWVETVESGLNKLVGADEQRIGNAIKHLRETEYAPLPSTHYEARKEHTLRLKHPFGDGDASQKIVEVLLKEWAKKSV